jgi:UDP-glucose 4-epimerase
MRGPVVVTGASGFIGLALVRRLAAAGVEVLAVSRRALPPELLPVARLVASYDETPGGAQLVHLAETSHIPTAEREGDVAAELRTALLARLAGRFDHVLYASSGAVYGDQLSTPRAPAEPVQPRSVYTRGKLACEGVVLGQGGTVARLGNAYGSPPPAGTIIADLLQAADRPGPLMLRALTPVRDYVHVDDVTSGLGALLRSARGGIFNVATGVGTSGAALARLVLELRGEPERLIVETAPQPRASTLVLDIGDTTRACGYVPRVTLRRGLELLIRGQEKA